MVIVETRAFTSRILDLLDDEDYRALQLEMVERPACGSVIPGTGGLRKVRWAVAGRGKRGGARVIYFWHRDSATILMLLAYAKNEQDDLTSTQRQVLRKLVEEAFP